MRNLLTSGLVAGLAAGLLCALLQYAFVQDKILLGERFELGELVHTTGGTQVHDHATEDAAPETAQPETTAGAHQHAAMGEDSPLRRNLLTVLFSVLTYAGYGLVLAALMAVMQGRGHNIDGPRAVLWGLAGFLAFQMMPAMGLAPDLPGTVAADITERQVWWAMTAAATLAGLGLLAFGGNIGLRLSGAIAMVLPHLIGAPQIDDFYGSAPPELSADFAASTLGVGLLTWLALGFAVWRLQQDQKA